MKRKRMTALIAILASFAMTAAPLAAGAEELDDAQPSAADAATPETVDAAAPETDDAAAPETDDATAPETDDAAAPEDTVAVGEEPSDTDSAAALEEWYQKIARILGGYAEQHYLETTGIAAAQSSCIFSEDGTTAEVTLTDETGAVLDVYTVDTQTGAATNRNGDEIDLTVYDTSVPEEEYFMPFDYMGDAAKIYFIYHEENAIRIVGCSTYNDIENGTVRITLYDMGGDTAEIYTVDIRTGIGTDRNGNAVDLSIYADYRPFEDSDYFISQDLLQSVAIGYYTAQTGDVPAGCWVTTYEQEMDTITEFTIVAEDDAALAVYTVDARTGIGTDQDGNPVDLAAFAETYDFPDVEPGDEVDESEFFASSDEIMEFAKWEYETRTDETAEGVGYSFDLDTLIGEIELYGADGEIVATYTIDLRTGIGTDQNGDPVDLSVYIPKPDDPNFYAPLEDLAEMAVVDYEQKTGTQSRWSSIELADDNSAATITLVDDAYEPIEVYTVDPYTATGTTSSGAAVNLPQTGNNVPGTAATAAGALGLAVSGLFMVLKSGVLRKKK